LDWVAAGGAAGEACFWGAVPGACAIAAVAAKTHVINLRVIGEIL
jgi:hypothetical protein